MRYVNLATHSLLILTGVTCFCLPDELVSFPTASAQAVGDTLVLRGIVRDFSNTHPDFDTNMAGGMGHHAGNIATTLGADGAPKYVGGGFKVATDWTDSANRPIAPHLYDSFEWGSCYRPIPGLVADGLVSITNQSEVDSFDSRLGAYGGANATWDALVATNATGSSMLRNQNSSTVYGNVLLAGGGDPATVYAESPNSSTTGSVSTDGAVISIPETPVPPNLGPSVGDLTFGPGPGVLDSSRHVDALYIDPDAVVTVKGNLVIVCDGDFDISNKTGSGAGKVLLAPGASLELHVAGNCRLTGELNYNTGDPGLCAIYKSGPGSIEVLGAYARVVARLFGPDAVLVARQSAEVFGTFSGSSIDCDNKSKFHMDIAFSDTAGVTKDLPGAAGPSGDGGISSSATFADWFSDTLGTSSLSLQHSIVLQYNADGVYEYNTTAFYPIDGRAGGNEGGAHNDLFTFTIDASFVYEECGGQMIEFDGNDDTWIFIDDKLVMDLGGVYAMTPQYVDLDRLDLKDGESYRLLFLHARRQTTLARFSLWTNIPLSTPLARTVSAPFD